MVVADMPYARVWAAAQEAVRDYPLERMVDGEIVTGWRERPARVEEPGFERVSERARLEVETFGTRVTAMVEARGWRDGGWAMIADTASATRDLLARIRAMLP
jgi:hypothetical protein